MPTLTCPVCGAKVQQDDLICFTCGANLPRADLQEDQATPPTIMQEQLRRERGGARACPNCSTPVADPADLVCAHCRQPLPQSPGQISPVVLRLAFPTGNVNVPAGTSLLLGRDPQESLVAAAFARFENVSRRHATISVTIPGMPACVTRTPRTARGSMTTGCCPAWTSGWPTATGVRLAADVTGTCPCRRASPTPPG